MRFAFVFFSMLIVAAGVSADHVSIQDVELHGIRLGMNADEVADSLVEQGFTRFGTGSDWFRFSKRTDNGHGKTSISFYYTEEKRIWKVMYSVTPAGRQNRQRGTPAPEPFYLELLDRFGTPDEGGPDTAKAFYRDGDGHGAATLNIESRGETAAVLEWPALKQSAGEE